MDVTSELRKYPKTPHLPWSPGSTDDDKWISDEALSYLRSGVELVVSEKMDGGNLSWYPDYFHGRSLDSGTHAWDRLAKAEHARVAHDIPAGWRISGESMYARRSVGYDDLAGPYYVFGVWDESNTLLDWDSMAEWCALWELPVVPVLYRGTDFDAAVKAWGEQRDESTSEGFVVRVAGRIKYDDFASSYAKWVRAGHVRTNDDWRHRDDFALNTFKSGDANA